MPFDEATANHWREAGYKILKNVTVKGSPWVYLQKPGTRSYWHNPDTGVSQYKSPIPAGPMAIVLILTILFLFFSFLLGRIWYLWKYEPSLLFPTKKPKERVQKWKRAKVKARGKMNQDGKGGRSANTT